MAANACAILGSRCSSASRTAFGYSLTVAAVLATASQWYVDENKEASAKISPAEALCRIASRPLRSVRTRQTVPLRTSYKPTVLVPEWNKALPASNFRATAAARTLDEIHSTVTATSGYAPYDLDHMATRR